MKQVLGVTLVGCAIVLSGCSSGSPSPKDVAQQYANDLEAANFQAASRLYVTSNSNDLQQFEQAQNTPEMQVMNDLFKHSKIVIGDEHINGNSATVDATVTSPNFGQVIGKIMQAALANAFSNQASSSSSRTGIANEMDNALNDPSVQTQTTKTEIKLTNTSNGWKISNDNTGLASAITGGASNVFAPSTTTNTTSDSNQSTSSESNSNVNATPSAPVNQPVTATNTVVAPTPSSVPAPTPAHAPTSHVAYIGQKVQVGPFVMEAPRTTKTPILRTSDDNVFTFGTSRGYFFIEMDVTNESSQPQTLSGQMFQLTWTPTGGNTHYYAGDTSEEYNVNTATYSNGQYYFGSPLAHQIAPKTTERMDLIYEIPAEISPNESGVIGVLADVNGEKQSFSLLQSKS